jgi:hypothetical protein
MFSQPDFLSTLGVGAAIGVTTAYWLTRWMRSALLELQLTTGIAHFWTSAIQLIALLLPLAGTLFAFSLDHDEYHRATAASIVGVGCAGALLAVFFAALIVGSSSSYSSTSLSSRDYSELRQLLLRMRDFRAHEIVRSSDAAAKLDQA